MGKGLSLPLVVILSAIFWGCATPPPSAPLPGSSPTPARTTAPPAPPSTTSPATEPSASPPALSMSQPAARQASEQAAEEFPPIVVAIMPFTNVSGQKDYDWLCTGIAESISTKLGSLPYFSLVERLKLSEAIKEIELGQTGLIAESKAAQTGQMAGAEELVTGSFQIVGQTIRINARFLKVEEAKIRTTAEATGKLDQIFELQDKIVASFLANLNLPLNDQEKSLLAAKPTTSQEAFQLYSRAMDTYTPEGKALNDEQRIALLNQSTRIDPHFAPAYTQLGDIYALRKQDYVQAESYYSRAVFLTPYVITPRARLVQVYQEQGNTLALQQQQRQIEEIRRSLDLQQAEKQRFLEERRQRAALRAQEEQRRAQELQRQRALQEQQKAQELQRRRALEEQQKAQELQRQRALEEQQKARELQRRRALEEQQKAQELQRRRALEEQQKAQELQRRRALEEQQKAQDLQKRRALEEQQKAQELQRQRTLQEQRKAQELQRQRTLQEQQKAQELQRQRTLQEQRKAQEPQKRQDQRKAKEQQQKAKEEKQKAQ